ncbi:similar to RIKEN cDNA 2610034E18 gene (predicted), isoform CRA_b [Rattus norvegicus]|uniref:Similar to RIKEN cDNA 2610034E18 gene (Predicted), isoform CRA_b n=1 Tax=Rattus norvegicus TaxID=10116 RepID=A6J5W2_RAT|nr:similar to RIKEN cDNA 2610034E18 gene (predicted), isoform CRA_b [Rattus norvegicus]
MGLKKLKLIKTLEFQKTLTT